MVVLVRIWRFVRPLHTVDTASTFVDEVGCLGFGRNPPIDALDGAALATLRRLPVSSTMRIGLGSNMADLRTVVCSLTPGADGCALFHMPRRARIVIPEIPHHVTQRGNQRQDVLFNDGDRRAYLGILAEENPNNISSRYGKLLQPR